MSDFTVLYYIVLHCTVLYCTALNCSVVYCTVSTTLHYAVLSSREHRKLGISGVLCGVCGLRVGRALGVGEGGAGGVLSKDFWGGGGDDGVV